MASHTLTSPDEQITIEWDCGFRNPATDSIYSRVVKEIEESDTGVRIMYALIIANTRRITFTYKGGIAPPEAIASFEKFWVWCMQFLYIQEGGINVSVVENPEIIKASYKLFNRLVCNPLQEHWGTAYNKAQVLFPAADIFKPNSMLPTHLLEDEDFLASAAKLLKA